MANSLVNFKSSRELQIITDSSGFITSISSNCSNILGFSCSEMLYMNMDKFIDCSIESLSSILNKQVSASKKDGQVIYFDISLCQINNSSDEIEGYELSCFQIDKYVEINNNYNEILDKLDKSIDTIFKYHFLPEPKFTYLSSSIEKLIGYTAEEFYRDPNLVFNLVHPEDVEIQKSKCNKSSDFSKPFCNRFIHKNGSYVWVEDYIIPTFNAEGELVVVQGITRDITERKKLEFKLEELSFTDCLTGLYNRTYLNSKLEILIKDTNLPVGAIVCDLDNLKLINDTQGHFIGDLYIKATADLLSHIFNRDCLVVRNGGDEFIIIIPNHSLEEASEMYENMLSRIDDYNSNARIPVMLSSGFAYTLSSYNIYEILNTADKAMYNNKFSKKNRIKTL